MLQSSKERAREISPGKSMRRWFPGGRVAAALGKSPRRRPEIYAGGQSMIPEKAYPDVIGGGYRFSEKIMLRQSARAG
jgi:hypothetical protein